MVKSNNRCWWLSLLLFLVMGVCAPSQATLQFEADVNGYRVVSVAPALCLSDAAENEYPVAAYSHLAGWHGKSIVFKTGGVYIPVGIVSTVTHLPCPSSQEEATPPARPGMLPRIAPARTADAPRAPPCILL